jgi:hypothetical protein
MAAKTFANWLHDRFGITLKQCAEELKEVLPGLGETITEAELELSDVATGNASTTKHGLLKKLSNVATEFMNGAGNWVSLVKASGADVDTGTDDAKFVTAKALEDSDYIKEADLPPGGATPGASVWHGPWTFYALRGQTISFADNNADGGTATFIFNGQETAPLAPDALAAAYQAAFEALTSVGAGKVVATRTSETVTLVFDLSITPTLITVGENNLLEGVDDTGDPDIFAVNTDLTDIGFDLLTPNEGDLIQDSFLQIVEGFTMGAFGKLYDETSHTYYIYYNTIGDPGYSGAERNVLNESVPFISDGTPLEFEVASNGGLGHTTGIAKVWIQVATPVAPE